ncbi:MAG: NRDE family protein, partial [Pseudomonadota bacterium]
MCTLVILRRPDHAWPLVLAGNRDELAGRRSRPPAAHWPDRPGVVAGLDEFAGGSWFGVNAGGVAAVVMNREGSLGPLPDKRSRGELVLEALDHAEAQEAAEALADLDPDAYRPFNLFVGDPLAAYWVRHAGDGRIGIREVPPGTHMIAAGELDDDGQARIRRFLPSFRTATCPQPERGDWSGWQRLLTDRAPAQPGIPETAMAFAREDGFRTRSHHLLAIPKYPAPENPPLFLYADSDADAPVFERVPV